MSSFSVKKMLRVSILSIGTLVGILLFAVPAFPQKLSEQECDKIYNEQFLPLRKTDQPQAYLSAKEFLQKCVAPADGGVHTYVKNWVTKYEWLTLLGRFDTATGGIKPPADFKNAFKYGKEILTKSPEAIAELVKLKAANGTENISVLIRLGYLGYIGEKQKDTSYRDEAIVYAKQAIQLLDSGKVPYKLEPFTDKDEALAWLNFALGYMQRESSPRDSAIYFYKTLSNPTFKSSAVTYIYLINYYTGEYLKVIQTIKTKCENLPDNDECNVLEKQQDAWLKMRADVLGHAYCIAQENGNASSFKELYGINKNTSSLKRLYEIFNVDYNGTDEFNAIDAFNVDCASLKQKPLLDPSMMLILK